MCAYQGQQYPPPQGYSQPGYAPAPGYAPQPAYAPQPGYPPAPGYPQPVALAPIPGAPSSPYVMAYPIYYEGKPYPENAMDALARMKSVWVSQKAQYLEGCCGCESKNKYRVYGTNKKEGSNKKFNKHDKLFKFKEESSCCQRFWFPGSLRSFKMDVDFNKVFYDSMQGKEKSKWVPFLRLERHYTCTCLCCNRPLIKVTRVDLPDKPVIGYVRDSFSCCDYVFDILDKKDGKPLFKVIADCCQCGFHIKCPCGPCSKIQFNIVDQKTESPVGDIKKVWSGCCKEIASNADDYSVVFPVGVDPNYKALLMAAVILIDYRHFEEAGLLSCKL